MAGMAVRTPALTWRMLAALRATLANSSEPAAAFPGRLSGAVGPKGTICIHNHHWLGGHICMNMSESDAC